MSNVRFHLDLASATVLELRTVSIARYSLSLQSAGSWPLQELLCLQAPFAVKYLWHDVSIGTCTLETNQVLVFWCFGDLVFVDSDGSCRGRVELGRFAYGEGRVELWSLE